MLLIATGVIPMLPDIDTKIVNISPFLNKTLSGLEVLDGSDFKTAFPIVSQLINIFSTNCLPNLFLLLFS